MIIENVDALKTWLAKLLEPICDADPAALANYVVALVKKDKTEKDLKALCADQLEVFLQKETVGFVDKLFECLTTKIYLGNPPPKENPKEEVKQPIVKAEPVEPETSEEERENRRRRSPLRNRSDFNDSRRVEERRREDRKRRDFDRHGKSGSSSDSHRERERHERRRGSPRGRSYSRSRSRSRSGSRGKSRDREHRRDFKSKFDVERKDLENFTTATSGTQNFTTASSGTPLQPQHPSPLLPTPPHPYSSSSGVSGPPGVPVATPAHLPDSTTDSWSTFYNNQRLDPGKQFGNKNAPIKQRCRDYDEKGFCVRGDLCPFDHGNDPLVVDDVNLPNMLPFPPVPVLPPPPGIPLPPMTEPPPPLRINPMPPYGQPPPPGVFPGPPLIVTSGIDTPNHQSALTSSPPIGPPGVGLPPPTLPPPPPSSSSVSLHPQFVQSEYNYDAEGYNPEAPGLTGAGRSAPFRHFIPRVQTQRSNLIGLTSNEGQGNRAANIVIQTEPSTGSTSGSNRSSSEQDVRKRSIETGPTDGPQPKKPWMDKPGFNNQHKGLFPKRNHYVNTKLEVRRIPRELNNITKLNEHFSKFGTIVNIQVVFSGDPEAALIQYTKNEEARRAISSTEAVLNNRFIRVYWHREPGANHTGAPGQEQSTGLQNVGPQTNHGSQHPNVHKGIKQHNAAAYVLNKTVPKPRPQTTPGTSGVSPADSSSLEAVTVASALTNSQKAPFAPTSLKSSSKSMGKTAKALIAQEALKQKQEALKLQQDMRKKKQEMLQTQIECQKALINRLEKNRGMKPEERANIMKTLKELTDKISQLQNDLHPAAQVTSAKANHNQPKNKSDAQKELLDAELDFHKKMNSGEDTTDLKRKLGQLQVEATWLGLIRSPSSRGRGRGKMAADHGGHVGRGRGRSRDGMGRGGTVNRMVVDHRPRALAILGVTQEEKEELMPHFLKFGEIEDLRDHDANSVVMTFKTRSEAENAANQGAKFKGRVLQISWYKPKTPSVTTEPEEEETKEEDSSKESGSFLAEEEEEEEDDDEDDEYESRSWRR